MYKLYGIIVFIAVAFFAVCAQAYPKDALLLFSEFKKVESQLEKKYVSSTNGLPRKYLDGLKSLHKHYQSQGALDELLAVKNEIERFQKACISPVDPFELVPELPPDAVVSTPEALRIGQERYIADRERIENTRLAELDNLSQGLLKRLESIQKKLTQDDRIDEALEIRKLLADSRSAIEGGFISEFAAKLASMSPSAEISTAKANKKCGSAFARWVALPDLPFSPNLHSLIHADLQSTVTISPHSIGKGFDFFATSGPDPQTVASTLCREVGQAKCWRVDSPEDLAVNIKATSYVLSQGRNKGPILYVAIFSGKNPIAMLQTPLTQKEMVVRIIRDPSNPLRYALFSRGGASKQFELRKEASVNVMVGVALVGARETCDTLIDFE